MKLIAYYRVSTRRQGESGLGLDGQRAAVESYTKAVAGQILGSFTEVESGRRPDRPELSKAIALTRSARGTLVVAKLDRLTRNAAFLHQLHESRLPFVACDNPHANKLTIQILAAIAEWEAETISGRIKAALAAYKARGGKLGYDDPRCRKGLSKRVRKIGHPLAMAELKRQAVEWRQVMGPVVRDFLKGGSQRQAATALNSAGYRTRRGKLWTQRAINQFLHWVPKR